MKRRVLIIMSMLLPLMVMSQGVIKRPKNKPVKTTTEQSTSTKQQQTTPQGNNTRSENKPANSDSGQTSPPQQSKPATTPASESNVKRATNATIVPITVNGVSFNMIKVEGGKFTMGATSEMSDPYEDEEPKHEVTLSTYYIGETEVTQALWKAVMGSNPSEFKGDNLPVESVSWDDCQDFINNLNQLTHKSFRLPTEAEWEFAARGGNKSNHTQYSGSSYLKDVAWWAGNSGDKTHPVKTKQANELGIYDMSGNVWEWCQDWKGKYSSAAVNNPQGPESGTRRVFRGGGCYSSAWSCRSSGRYHFTPDNRNSDLGLRLVFSE